MKVVINKKNLLQYLQEELDLSDASLQMALRHREQDPGPLPMILWKYGLVTLEQLDQIYDWFGLCLGTSRLDQSLDSRH